MIVPDIRMSLITYKGDPASSVYIEFHTPLVPDPYELLNFMRSVNISGGSAEGYAAIKAALEAACNQLSWRSRTNKVIVIIGDAPPFPKEERDCLEMARNFEGKISAIYKPSSGSTLEMEPVTTAFFQKLATSGDEEDLYMRHEKQGDMVRRIVRAILGERWEKQINDLFEQQGTDRWMKLIHRKLEEEGYEWFFHQFKRTVVRPELVDALITIGGKPVAREMWRLLSDKRTRPWVFQRALYVLNGLTDAHVDYMSSPRDRLSPGQRFAMAELLKRLYGEDIVE
jgi:hypothetical protein